MEETTVPTTTEEAGFSLGVFLVSILLWMFWFFFFGVAVTLGVYFTEWAINGVRSLLGKDKKELGLVSRWTTLIWKKKSVDVGKELSVKLADENKPADIDVPKVG